MNRCNAYLKQHHKNNAICACISVINVLHVNPTLTLKLKTCNKVRNIGFAETPPQAAKPVLSRWDIFVAIANNTLYWSK